MSRSRQRPSDAEVSQVLSKMEPCLAELKTCSARGRDSGWPEQDSTKGADLFTETARAEAGLTRMARSWAARA